MWLDLAKFRHFGKILQVLSAIFVCFLVFDKCYLWWQNNFAIWSHCYFNTLDYFSYQSRRYTIGRCEKSVYFLMNRFRKKHQRNFNDHNPRVWNICNFQHFYSLQNAIKTNYPISRRRRFDRDKIDNDNSLSSLNVGVLNYSHHNRS